MYLLLQVQSGCPFQQKVPVARGGKERGADQEVYHLEEGNGGTGYGNPFRDCCLLRDPWCARCCSRYDMGELFNKQDVYVVYLKPLGV